MNLANSPKKKGSEFFIKLSFAIVFLAIALFFALFSLYNPKTVPTSEEEQNITIMPGNGQLFQIPLVTENKSIEAEGFYEKLQNLGPVGDFISGSLTPWFTLASFLLIYSSLLAQRSELRNSTIAIEQANDALKQNANAIAQTQEALDQNQKSIQQQQDSLELNRKALEQQEVVIEMTRIQLESNITEMQSTRKEMEAQGYTLAVQRFENTFFNLLAMHNETVNTLKREGKEGRSCINDLYLQFVYNHYDRVILPDDAMNLSEHERYYKTCEMATVRFKETEWGIVGPYFNGIYQIIKLIRDIEFGQTPKETDKLKSMYADILKTRFSLIEMHILLCISLNEDNHKYLDFFRDQKFFSDVFPVKVNGRVLIQSEQVLDTYNKLFANECS